MNKNESTLFSTHGRFAGTVWKSEGKGRVLRSVHATKPWNNLLLVMRLSWRKQMISRNRIESTNMIERREREREREREIGEGRHDMRKGERSAEEVRS